MFQILVWHISENYITISIFQHNTNFVSFVIIFCVGVMLRLLDILQCHIDRVTVKGLGSQLNFRPAENMNDLISRDDITCSDGNLKSSAASLCNTTPSGSEQVNT